MEVNYYLPCLPSSTALNLVSYFITPWLAAPARPLPTTWTLPLPDLKILTA